MPFDKTDMARLNRKNVLKIIQEMGPINKAKISKLTGLSVPTVMNISDNFEKQKLIRNVGKGESTGGKRPVMLEFVADAHHIMGIDIGRDRVKMVIMTMDATVKAEHSFSVTEEKMKEPEDYFDEIGSEAENMLAKYEHQIMGIGIAMPGILDCERKNVLFSPDFNWKNLRLEEILMKQIRNRYLNKYLEDHYMVMIENATRSCALGEYIFGAARESEYMLGINLGHGIGGAFIDHGKIVSGMSGSSGEFGHMVMNPNGPVCDCGNRGCLEAISSGNAIAKRMELEINKGKNSLITKLTDDINKIEAKDVFTAAKQQDELSVSIIDHAIHTLGIAIANCINLMDPDMIILAGGLTKSSDYFIDALKEVVRQNKMEYSGRNTKIRIAKLGEFGTAIGAATLVYQHFVENGGNLVV